MYSPQVFRRGFTLIELLVVVAIVGSLLGLATLSLRPSRGTEIRQAAQSLASLLLSAQSRALGNEAGAALWITSTGIYDAAVRSDLVGDFTLSSAVAPLATTTSITTSLPLNPPSIFRARFIGQTPDPTPLSPWLSASGTNPITVQFAGSQTKDNTVWPARFYSNPNDPRCRIQFSPTPQKSTVLYRWPKLARIDTRFCGFRSQTSINTDPDIAIVFDSLGRPEIILSGQADGVSSAVSMEGPLFLLVSYRADVEDTINGAPLQNEDSIWVALHPETGRTTVSWNVPSDNLTAARANSSNGLGLSR